AGVQRATVYRHFPDEQALFDACTAHYFRHHPMPDPDSWAGLEAPEERLTNALGELYDWFAETEQMLAHSVRDLDRLPLGTREWFLGYFELVRAALMDGRRERGRSRARLAAAIGH